MRTRRVTLALVSAGLLATTLLVPGTTAAARTAVPHCSGQSRIAVPGAEKQKTACLDDLTTSSTVATGHTNANDWAGLNAPGTTNPSGVAGIQVDGYFPDTSTSNANNGWNHDAQFVIRLPDSWNGKLVVSGAPGTRTQYAGDFLFSDWLLARGYAYAMTDKGNNGSSFQRDGATPGDAIAEWNTRVTQLTQAVKQVVAQKYASKPKRTYLFGISNGGYLVRWQLENQPALYDGGVDWEGTLFRADGPNLLTYLPTALRDYPKFKAGDEAAHQRMIDAGFAPGSEFTWDYHYSVYWDLTQRLYREELDPTYDGALDAGIPFCQSGTPSCDADYDYATRPAAHDAVRKVELTGNIGKPLLTLHGTLDALLPIATDSDVYQQLVQGQGRGGLHRYYRVVDGTHVDGLRGTFQEKVRPLLPCARTAFDAMTAWVEKRTAPPASATIPRAPGTDEVNTCALR